MNSPGAGPEGPQNSPPARETNVWNAVIALIVVGALVILVIYLVDKYGANTEKVTSVLGVAAPVLAAAFGITLGYYTGQTKGQANGREQGKAEVKDAIRARLETVESAMAAGGGTSFAPGERGGLDPQAALHQIRGIVEAP